MTESQRPPISPPPPPRVPPIPPPPKTPNHKGESATQRQPAQASNTANAPAQDAGVDLEVTIEQLVREAFGMEELEPPQSETRTLKLEENLPPPESKARTLKLEENLPPPESKARTLTHEENMQRAPTTAATREQASPSLEQLVLEAHNKGISDLHLGVGEVPRFRERGEIITTNYPQTDAETFNGWLREILTEQQIEQFKQHLEYDGATQYEGVARVRINIFDTLRGYAMVLRLIPLKILTMEQLSLPPVFRDLCHHHKGLILVTGPTGSGKSTTMAAMIDYINKEMPKHIISIEDPIEFVHQSRKALIKQREIGINTLKFDNALKASLREDPDIILIGEMRDRETVNTSLKAAQTGHLVFGTLHTNSAVKTIERILNLYNPDEQGPMRVQVAESLVAVIAQSLVRTTDSKRAAIHEIMINTDAIKDYIIRNQVEEIESMIPRCNFEGMMTMNQCLYRLYEEGRITEETALETSPKSNEMAMMLRGRM